MGSANLRALLLFIIMALVAGCNGTGDDLNPSASNNLPPQQPNTIGIAVGQKSPNFTLSDTLENNFNLASAQTATPGVVVLYFSMQWCPVCEVHLDHLRAAVIPGFPKVSFYVVDYTCASVAEARNWEQSSGYEGGGWTVLADTSQSVLQLYQATMGTTVVIDQAGVIQMNEDLKDGTRLQEILASLP